MPDRPDVTTGYLDPGWIHPPTPGTPAAALMEASDAEVHKIPDGTGLVALAWAQDRIEEATR